MHTERPNHRRKAPNTSSWAVPQASEPNPLWKSISSKRSTI